MQVFVNNIPVTIFSGATALDALRRYCTNAGIAPAESMLYDAYGNIIAEDSPMNEGRKIFTTHPLPA